MSRLTNSPRRIKREEKEINVDDLLSSGLPSSRWNTAQRSAVLGFPLQELEALRAPENGPWLAGATQKNPWGGFFLKEGFKLTLKACEQGSPNSLGMYKMAQMYELGIGTPVDMDKAVEWMRCSVRLSDPQSGARKARDWLAANGVET